MYSGTLLLHKSIYPQKSFTKVHQVIFSSSLNRKVRITLQMHFSLHSSTSRSADCTYNALLIALIYGAIEWKTKICPWKGRVFRTKLWFPVTLSVKMPVFTDKTLSFTRLSGERGVFPDKVFIFVCLQVFKCWWTNKFRPKRRAKVPSYFLGITKAQT